MSLRARVAVGKGVEWKGVKVYLSLLWDLVGVERNRQNLIAGPALWTESYRLARLGKPEAELKGLPAATDEPHEGWAR
jgi:hypothetical protein